MALSKGSNFRTAIRSVATRCLLLAFETGVYRDDFGTGLQRWQHGLETGTVLLLQGCDGQGRLDGALGGAYEHADVQSTDEALALRALVAAGADGGQALGKGG